MRLDISKKTEDFSHNLIYFQLKCPICGCYLKPSSRVRIRKNLPSLNWHLRNDCFHPSNEELYEIDQVQKKISKALYWGMLFSMPPRSKI